MRQFYQHFENKLIVELLYEDTLKTRYQVMDGNGYMQPTEITKSAFHRYFKPATPTLNKQLEGIC